MDFNFKISSHIITVIGSAFLMFNLKMQFADTMWNYFCALEIFIFNFPLLINSLKEILKNKKVKSKYGKI
jgi:hypothetical protein